MTSDQITTILQTADAATTPAKQAKADKTKQLLQGLGLAPTTLTGPSARELHTTKNGGPRAAATEAAPSVAEPIKDETPMSEIVAGMEAPVKVTAKPKGKGKPAKAAQPKPAKPPKAAKPSKPKETKMSDDTTAAP